MGVDCDSLLSRTRCVILSVAPLASNISGERSLFHPSVNSRLLESFKRRRLGVSQPRFRAALGKSPAPAAPCANQQELDAAVAYPVANRRNLLAFAHLAKLRQSNEPGWYLIGPNG